MANRTRRLVGLAAGRVEAQGRDDTHRSAVRVFRDFTFRTRDRWHLERGVIGKAEPLAVGPNPRFIVTSFEGLPTRRRPSTSF